MTENNTKIIYRKASPEDYPAITSLIRGMGWIKKISDPSFFKMIDNSDRTVIAIDDLRVVGFARAICDEESIGYITDVAVLSEKQGQGIGSRLVAILIQDNPNIKWVISTSSEGRSFWEKQGFTVMNNAMERKRASDKPVHQSSSPPKNKLRKYLGSSLRKLYKVVHFFN